MRQPHSSEKTLFQLLDLEIGDSEEKIIVLYGEPNSRCYEVVGTYQLQEQSLFTYMIYDDKMIVVRKYFDETKDYDNQNGIVEIESSGGKYESTKGIKIGDSIVLVSKKFALLKKPVNPSRFRTHPAVPELSALCIILAVFLKGGKNVSADSA